MDRPRNFAEPDPAAHREDELVNEIASMGRHERDTENAIFPAHSQHAHEAGGLVFHHRAINLRERKRVEIVGHAALFSLVFVEPDARHFRVEIGAPRDDRIVRLRFQKSERDEDVASDDPCLVVGHMRELVGPRNVAGGEDVRLRSLQAFVHFHALFVGADTGGVKVQRAGVWRAPSREQQRGGTQFGHSFTASNRQDDLAGVLPHTLGFRIEETGHAIRREHLTNQRRSFGVLLRQQARALLHERHFHAEARKCLRQFAADRPTAKHEKRVGACLQPVEDRFVGEERHALQTVDLRHGGTGAGGDDKILRAQRAASDRDFMR